MNLQLQEKLKSLPAAPGVYFHKDSSGEIIYVGKAAVLKNRVRSYFRNDKDRDPKTAALVSEIVDTDWRVVDTELDALFLESEMIKRYKPRWNILLRDDKTVSYVRISMQEKVPYVIFTRNPIDDGATYIGPFYSKTPIEKALRALRKIFPYYIKPYNGKKTLDSDLGLAPGIEQEKITPRKYKNNLKKLIRVLNGEREELLRELEKEMAEAAKKNEFELAAELRNQIFGLKELRQKIIFSDREFLDLSSDEALTQLAKLLNIKIPPRRIEGYDVSHQSGTNVVASMVVFQNGAADRSEYRKFKIHKEQNNDFANMCEVLTRRLNHPEWPTPDAILIDGGKPQLEAVKDILAPTKIPYFGLAEKEEIIIVPTKSGYREYNFNNNTHVVKLVQRIRDEAHRFAITYHTHLARKNLFK